MPRTRSLAWSELKLGVLTITALVIGIVTISLVMGGSGFFWQRMPLKTRFANVAGLKPGSPVRLAGVEVGTITDVVLAGEVVEVRFEVKTEYAARITTESVARLGSVSLLGESAVDISPSSQGTPIEAGAFVPSNVSATGLAELTDTASQGLEDLSALVRDLREGRGTVGRLLTDDSLYTELERFVSSAGDVTRAIREGQGALGKFVSDPTMASSLEQTLANLDDLTRRINAGEGSLGRLLTDDRFAQSLETTTTNLSEITGKLSRGEGTAGRLLQDEALYERLDSLAARFDGLLTNLEAGQGTAGQLLHDEKLYENMNGVLADFRSLLGEIQQDPKKYLNIKISLF